MHIHDSIRPEKTFTISYKCFFSRIRAWSIDPNGHHIYFTRSIIITCFAFQIKYNLYWKWSWNWNIFINVSRIKEVTIEAINKSSWINWIKILPRSFILCCFLSFVFNSLFFLDLLKQKNAPSKKKKTFALTNTAAAKRNFQIIAFFSLSPYELWLFWFFSFIFCTPIKFGFT